jgi:crotonobetainyl-CoA:carnitine CoA-transferase CaiB-like acyl-CoA transferase
MPELKASLLRTELPDGRHAVLQPPSHPTPFLNSRNGILSCAPRLGQHNSLVWAEAGFSVGEIEKMAAQKVI